MQWRLVKGAFMPKLREVHKLLQSLQKVWSAGGGGGSGRTVVGILPSLVQFCGKRNLLTCELAKVAMQQCFTANKKEA